MLRLYKAVRPKAGFLFESFPKATELPNFGEEGIHLANVTHLEGQTVSIDYSSVDPEFQATLHEEGDGQWKIITEKGASHPIASLRREGGKFFWEWSKVISKEEADKIRNGFLIFKSNMTEKRIALRKPRIADSFAWTYDDSAKERNNFAVEIRSSTIEGTLPKGILFLDVVFPDGRVETQAANKIVSVTFPEQNKALLN